jgi:undecaprenyl phosphate-alpha-L-ara4FN deformylase
MDKLIGIKVDVDTSEGMKHGVPTLLSLFDSYGIPASFFVPMGKDHTGWTAKRVFTRKGFLKKAGRVGVLGTYGVKTLMYGLLLPGPEFARKNLALIEEILVQGHDLGIHGHDHVFWHDYIKDLSRERTERELEKAFSTFKDLTGREPDSFAAPGWMVNVHALRFFAERGILFTSNTRGDSPYFPRLAGEAFGVLEVPTTLPTLDEVVGIAGIAPSDLCRFFLESLSEGINIMTVHTELEGDRWAGFLEMFIGRALESGFTFRSLRDIATDLRDEGSVPACDVAYGSVSGRAGEVCLQLRN